MPGSRFVYVTYIRTTPGKLWHALTTPEIIKRYRFGMSVESEWKVGSTWRMYADGSLMDSGEILESVPQKPADSKFIGAVSEGWPMVLSNLKSLLETGDVALVYHRGPGDS
jgi:uncharacterized protein YndB with AHSA1/START domain